MLCVRGLSSPQQSWFSAGGCTSVPRKLVCTTVCQLRWNQRAVRAGIDRWSRA